MKNLRIIPLAFVLLTVMSGCEPEEVAPVQLGLGRPIDDKAPNPPSTSIPPDEVIRTDYSGATKWRITFHDPNMLLPHTMNYQRFFDVETGQTYSLHDLNASGKATAAADMNFLFGSLKSVTEYEEVLYENHPQLVLSHPEMAHDTKFVPTELSHLELAVMTAYQPEQFQVAFESSPYLATSHQPFNYELDGDEPPSYQVGQIYLFMVQQTPARYGAVRIVEKATYQDHDDQSVVEIIVQSDNYMVELAK